MIFYRTENMIIRDRSDFRFTILDKRFFGSTVFPNGSNKAPIKYKGKIVAEASFSCVAKVSFVLFARLNYLIHGQNPPIPIDNFRADLNTKCLDINHDWIYTGDLVTRLKDDEIYEVKVCPKSGEFFLTNIKDYQKDYSPNNKTLTDEEDYSIVGSNIEGIIDKTWYLHE